MDNSQKIDRLKKYDVIVIGLGAMGAATAGHLSTTGMKVLGIDRFSPPHSFGSSSGKSRIIRQAYFEDERYVPLLKRSYELWRELEIKSNQPLLSITGALMIGSESDKVLKRSYATALRYHIPSELLHPEAIRQKYPQFHLDSSMMALLDHTAGFIFPEKAIKVALELATLNGADLHTDEQVLHWQNKPGGVLEVKTASHTFQAHQLVICAGAWTKNLLPNMRIPLPVERVIQFWMRPVRNAEMFASGHLPVFMISVKSDLLLYGIPALDPSSEGVKVALHALGPLSARESCIPDTVNREVTKKDFDLIKPYLEKYVPALNGKCLNSSVCMYTNTFDFHPVIDFHPDHPKVIVAAGFSGHGFKFSSGVGEIVSELVLKGKSALQLDIFKFEKFLTYN